MGERLAALAATTGMLIMACDKCAYERGIATSLVAGARIGCFPDLYGALEHVGINRVITL